MKLLDVNRIARFLLEVAAYASMATWGWQLSTSLPSFVTGLGAPIIAALVMGTFAVPGDATRNRKPPVAVSGIVRLSLEIVFFLLAALILYVMEMTVPAAILLVVTCGHYVADRDRVNWLLQTGHRRKE
ncbi:YrdB family protein [Dehalococcoidia bacterium]|nr:YrdB family protein [Dehalococcoidia bacterium]